MMIDRFVDATEVVRSAVGRPRSALWLGDRAHAHVVDDVGGRVVSGDEEASAQVDLVYVERAASADGASRPLANIAKRLTDGGHVAVESAPSLNKWSVYNDLRMAGLDPLWRHAGSPSSPAIMVARKPPEKRPLSLTVGMISMNEAGAVGGVIDSIRQQVPSAEVLLVDSSKDETPAIAESKGARVLRQFPPRGYGPAMTRLLYSATTDVIVTMDCDGTYPADRIRELHERVERGADLVNASRTHHRPKAMPFANYLANRTFAAAAGVVHRYWTTDLHSGMRAYRTSMLRGMYVPEKGAALPVELLLVPARHGYKLEDIDIEYFERVGTTTLHRWDSTKWTFRRIANAALRGGATIRV